MTRPQPVEPTIAAIATAPGRGGVGVVRISGTGLLPMAEALSDGKIPAPRRALYTDFHDAAGHTIDSGLMLYFPGPASFTGEDVLELQGHGGPVVLDMLLERCLQLGARMAEPGEFSKRAFLNNKMDLAQAESVADLIDAGSRSAARLAVRSLKGAFSEKVHALTDNLVTLRMLVEATLDFPEEDIDFLQEADAAGKLGRLREDTALLLEQAGQGALLREGIHIVLLGAPNAGKSSLLNALAEEDVAIVTDIPGTTRDTVRERIVLDGIPVHIIDTAGLRTTEDIVERYGIERSRKAVTEADVVLLLTAPGEGINEETREILASAAEDTKIIDVHSKADISGEDPGFVTPGAALSGTDTPAVAVSSLTGAGLDTLKKLLLEICGWQGTEEHVFLARRRHLQALESALEELQRAAEHTAGDTELLAEHLRLAQQALGAITGEFTADDLLGVIFSRFCIGK